jgi:hypothetical protein
MQPAIEFNNSKQAIEKKSDSRRWRLLPIGKQKKLVIENKASNTTQAINFLSFYLLEQELHTLMFWVVDIL